MDGIASNLILRGQHPSMPLCNLQLAVGGEISKQGTDTVANLSNNMRRARAQLQPKPHRTTQRSELSQCTAKEYTEGSFGGEGRPNIAAGLLHARTTPHHTTPHHTTPHHTTPHHTTPHHTTPHHTTPHHTLSTPQLYPWAGCRVRSPGRQGPGTANRRCTNSVGCAHVPVPSTIPRDPAAPSTGRLGPGNGQRPPVEDG